MATCSQVRLDNVYSTAYTNCLRGAVPENIPQPILTVYEGNNGEYSTAYTNCLRGQYRRILTDKEL